MYITHTQIERVDIKDAGLKKGIMEMGCSAIASQGMCTSRVILYIVSVMENVASRWSWKTSIVYIYIYESGSVTLRERHIEYRAVVFREH